MKAIKNKYYLMSENKFSPEEFLEKIEVSESPQNIPGDIKKVDRNEQIITFQYHQTTYECSYKIEELISQEIYILTLQFNYEDSKQNAARAFSEFLKYLKIIKNANYYLTTISDDLSIYYTNKLHGLLAEYEQNLRSLILAIFVPVYGIEWHKKLENKMKTTKLKITGSDKEKTEKGLYNLNLNVFETILFYPFFSVESENYREKFSVDKIDELNKEDLITLIQKNQPYTFWEKYISNYTLKDLSNKDLESIRAVRNEVAHTKEFSYDKYKKANDKLEEVSVIILEVQSSILKNKNKEKNRELADHTSEIMAAYLEQISKSFEGLFQPKVDFPTIEKPEIQFTEMGREIEQTIDDAIEPMEHSSITFENPIQPYIDRLLEDTALDIFDFKVDDEDNNENDNEDNDDNCENNNEDNNS